jgi:hypothetical protein
MDFLGIFSISLGEWIDWLRRLTLILGIRCFGLKRKAGGMLKRAKVVLRRARFRVGSNSLGSKSITKKFVLVGSDAVVDLSLVSSSGFERLMGRSGLLGRFLVCCRRRLLMVLFRVPPVLPRRILCQNLL